MTARVISGDRTRTLDEVRDRAARLATGLQGLGVEAGGRFAIVMRNETAFLECSLAAGLMGASPVPVNWHWTGDDLAHVLRDSEVSVVLVHADLAGAVREQAPAGVTVVEAEVPPEVASAYGIATTRPSEGAHTLEGLISANPPEPVPSSQPAMGVIYTSGTTGRAKGILRNPVSEQDRPAMFGNVADLLKMKSGWTILMTAPLYHSAPNVQAVFAAGLNMDIVIMPRFEPEEFLRVVQEHSVQTVQMVPTMFVRLLQLPESTRAAYDLSSLEAVVHAAAPCPPEVKRQMIEWLGPIVHEYYGSSEIGAWTLCDSEEALARPGTVGRPFADSAIRILDEKGTPVGPGEEGTVYGKTFSGWPDFTYLGADQKRRDMEEARDGFLTIGDVGRLDQDGYLYLSDRLSDMVISGGVNIYPAEIETCILGLDGVEDVAVFGIPHAEFGEALAAHVQPAPGANITEDDVRARVSDRLARYKVPSVVRFEDSLPREDTGKLFKRRLRALYVERGVS